MEFFNPNSTVDFMGARRWTTLLSVFIVVFSVSALLWNGLKWGLDFTGGTQIEVTYPQAVNVDAVRETLSRLGFSAAQVIRYGSAEDILISIAPREDLNEAALVERIMQALPGATKQRVDYVGPQVGAELASKGALAIVVSLFAIMLYIALRFEARLAFSSVVALVHDPILILGIFAWFGLEFDLKALAGLLAVIGYSLNDTIVVFDRVRENFIKMRRATPLEVMNQSINQTLSRTIMTSALTLLVVLSLLVYGGETIRGFALALVIGIVIGTYSSIYVAGACAMSMGLNRNDFIKPAKKEHELI